jgi:hypothetical protein
LLAKEALGGKEAAVVVKFFVQVGQAQAQVDAHGFGNAVQPLALLRAKAATGSLLRGQPAGVALLHPFRVGRQFVVQLHHGPHQGDEVGQYFGAAQGTLVVQAGVGVPQGFGGPLGLEAFEGDFEFFEVLPGEMVGIVSGGGFAECPP